MAIIFSLKGNQQKLQHNFSFVHIFQWITNAYDLWQQNFGHNKIHTIL